MTRVDVVDLGRGSGLDAFVAARRAGPSGEVPGVPILASKPEQPGG
jgi:hypothetical protein